MKPAFQKDQVFIAAVRRAINSRERYLWWLGQSGFLVVQDGRAMLFDPYLSDSLTRKYQNSDKPHVRMTERVVDPAALGTIGVIDLIASSHHHTDHFDAETLLPLLAANPQARLVLPAAQRNLALERLGADIAARLIEMDDGTSASFGDLEIRTIASAHPTVERDVAGHCRFLGYIIRWGERHFYHSGDTLWHEGLVPALRRFSVDIALLPINGDRPERRVAGNLDGRQAAQLAHAIGARLVVPCHFDLFEFNTASPEEFVAECARLHQPYRVLQQGESFSLTPA